MTPKTAFIYSDELSTFSYAESHPFKPMRARNTVELCRRYALMYNPQMMWAEPEHCNPELFTVFHHQDYISALQQMSAGHFDPAFLMYGVGTDECPLFSGLFEFCTLSLGATLRGVDILLANGVSRAINLVGGFHHAYPDHAEGFCYTNDVAIAIHYLLSQGYRVAFVDIDAHHCNGVQAGFYDNDQVLVISLHESGKTLYPFGGFETEIGTGRGIGFNVNVPLPAHTDDEIYVEAFNQIVPSLLSAFSPSIVIAEIGADTHYADPLTHLALTSNGYAEVVKKICELSPRLLALGGGGYEMRSTTRCWTRAWALMNELEPQDQFAGLVGGMMYGNPDDDLYEPPKPINSIIRDGIKMETERIIRYIHSHIFPILGAQRP